MKRLTAEQIAAADDLATADVHVEEWGGIVTVREMSAGERLGLGDLVERSPNDIPFWLVAVGLVDAEGKQLFPDPEAAIPVLRRRSFASIKMLAAKVRELSGLGTAADDEDEDAAEEEKEKN